MPDFLTIQRQHEKAKAKGLVPQDSSLADFAKIGANATGDPSYQEVAESPAWKNMIRSWSANVDEAIQSGPVDDWTAEAFGWVGDKFGVTPEASRAAGRELPRQVMNFVPMAAGAAIGSLAGPGGTAVGAKIGLGLTSGLSAFDAYGKGGTATDAIIGGVAPYVGGKLSEFGSKAALKSAATPGSFLNRMGFMKGKDILNPATHTVTDAATGLSKQVLGETVDTFRDKALGYVAGEALANVGFTGLDIVQQGPDAVLNRDYLFANLASNIPFMAADIPNFTKTRFAWEPVDKFLVPTQEQINAEKTRGEKTRESLDAIDNSLAKFQREAELGVDVGRFIVKNNEVAATMEGHRAAIKLEAENFQNTWSKLREANSALPDVLAGIDPKVLLQNPSVIGFDPAKALVQEYAQKLKQINKVKGGNLSRIAKSDADLEKVMGLVEEDLKLPETFLNTPVLERTVEQYQKALGTKLSDNAVKLIRMKHMEVAQGEDFVPEFPKLWEEHNKALTGKFEGSIDDRYELITASLLATGRFPKVVKAQKKAAQEAKAEGQTKVEASKNVTSRLQREVLKAERADIKASLKGLGKLTSQQLVERLAAAQRKATDASHPLASAWARVVEATSAQLAKRAADPASKPKVGAPKGPRKATLDKSAAMEERINRAAEAPSVKKHKFADTDAGPAHTPVDEPTFLIAASLELSADPKLRLAGLSWLSEVMTNHAGKPWAEQFTVFKEGLKTAGRHDVQDGNLVPINTEITPDRIKTPGEEADADAEFAQGQKEAIEELVQENFDESDSSEVKAETVEVRKTPVQERDLLLKYLAAVGKKAKSSVAPETALTAINANKEHRALILEKAIEWEQNDFQLAARDIDPRTVSLITSQPLPIREFATAWAKEAGVPEAEIPATVDDFVRITQMFAAGESRFGKLEGTVDGMQFARASAGAFDFGMREVKNGQIQRPGKPPLGTKDGWMTELDFRNNGGELGPLQKDEVTFYKQLVPEAFADGKVHLQKLWDGLNKVGEQVKVVTYGQDGMENPDKVERDRIIGELDRIGIHRQEGSVYTRNGSVILPNDPSLSPDIQKMMRELPGVETAAMNSSNFDPKATSYYNQISPFDTKKFPVVRVDVVLPSRLTEAERVEFDNLDDAGAFNTTRYKELANKAGQDLWEPDNLHENLPNTLGWAMVQVVPSSLIKGYKPKAPDGWIGPVYRGSKTGSLEQNPNAKFGPAYYFSTLPEDAAQHGDVKAYFIKPQTRPSGRSIEEVQQALNAQTWDTVGPVPLEDYGGDIWAVKNTNQIMEVPDELVMFVGEAQSRWGQERRNAEKRAEKLETPRALEAAGPPSHPLLSFHQNLILKAVIKEAQKRGIRKVAISDGETAMMTEGHDKAANYIVEYPNILTGEFDGSRTRNYGDPESAKQAARNNNGRYKGPTVFQEGGMRLAYDTTLPSIMSKLVGEGRMEDFGVHKNAKGALREPQSGETLNGETVYQTSDEAWHDTYEEAYQHEAEITGIKGSPVFRNPDGTPKTNVTARVYDISSPSERVNTLFARGGTIYGAAFKDIAQAFFSTKAFQGPNKTKAMGYVLAHEMGHIAFGKAMRGEYGLETKQLFDEAIGWVKTNDPAVLRDVEEVIRELYLPKEMKNLDGVKDVLGNLEPEEWMANAHAMMVTGAMQANKPVKALLLLPKTIRTVVENTIRRVQDALRHARMYWKLSGDKNKMAQVLRVKDMVDSVRSKFREAEWQTAQAIEFLDINPAGLLNRMENIQFARSPYPVEGVKQKLGNFFNNATQGLGGFMATYRSFIEPGFKLLDSGNTVTEQVSESLTPIFGHRGATDNIVVDKSLPWFKLSSSKPLYDLVKRINLEAQDSKESAIVQNPDGTVSFNWRVLSPEHRAEVKLYNPDQQKAMAQFLMQKEQSTRITQRHNVEHETNKARMFAVNLVTRMRSFDQGAEPVVRHKEARVVAEKLFDAVQMKDEAAIQEGMKRFADPKEAQKLVDIIQEKQDKLASLSKFYADQPNFQSLRRFKPIIQRYTDANGESKVLDFNKGSEALAMRKELEAKGWKAVGEPIVRDFDKKYKNEFTVDSKVVDLLESKEGRLKDLIDSMDIDPVDREALLGESTFLADVLRETKSNDIYLPGVKRRISGGPEHLDMLEQHLTYTQAAHKVGYMTALGEELKYHMNNPELKDQLREKTQFMEFYKQAKESDPKFWRVVNKANAVWHIGFNLPGHLAELFQPLQTHIHEAVYQGHSMLTALRTVVGAEKSAAGVIAKLIKSKIGYHDDAAIWENWPDKDEAAMLKVNWRRSLTQPLQEVYQQVGVNQETLRGIVQEREMLSPSKILTKPLNMYPNAAMGLYSVFTQHNNLVGLLTGYRLAKKKGLSHEEAVKSAALFELTANNSGGRTERPVYFGKLGHAGYMVYALSSYVRGRFTDLARYYRHGFDKVNFPELNQSDRRAARQAFASMIAGQLAAAGILGFPFIGAGIALMEDLTGEEIKGSGMAALNEMTDDPLLTQALSYGVMSSMAESLGIPADLHSRFALGGFMGLNSYDGISAASVLGPTASMVNSMWKMGKALVQEKDLGAAFRAGGPGGVKRMAEALSEEFQAENPDANLPMAMAGFRSGKMFKNKEMERIVSKTNEAAQNDIKLAAKRVEESLVLGPQVAQATLMREANLLIDQRLEGRGRQVALKDMMSNLRQRIALQKVKEQMPSDLRGKATVQTASKISDLARVIGYQPPPAGNVEQEQIMRHVYQQLGAQRSQASMRRARERQMELEQNPGMFY